MGFSFRISTRAYVYSCDNTGENQTRLYVRVSGRDVDHEIASDESVSMAVVRVVSALEDRDPVTLPPLSTVLDPDALDALFQSTSDGKQRIGGHVSFIYSECEITVDHGEYLIAEPLSPLELRGTRVEPSDSGHSKSPDSGE